MAAQPRIIWGLQGYENGSFLLNVGLHNSCVVQAKKERRKIVMKKLLIAIFFVVLLVVGVYSGWSQTPVKGLTFISPKPGGTWYVLTTGYANRLSTTLDKITIRIDASTGGTQQNVQIIGQKAADFGLGAARDSFEAFNGIAYHKGHPAPNLRAVFWLSNYRSVEHIAVRASLPVKSFGDMDGRTFNAGVAGGAQDFIVRSRSEILGIKPKIQNMSITDAVDRLKDGLLDGLLHGGGIPIAAITDLFTTHSDRVKLVGYTEAEAKKILEAQPGYFRYVIPANSYKGQTEPVNSIADSAMMVANKDVPDEIVYQFVKVIYSGPEEVAKIHRTAGPLDIKDNLKCSIPIHPGAIKYYEERGLTIPDSLRPKK
jgi:TRAP transporter TAXI family solute receptor